MQTRLRNFLLSLPERGLRSATALAGGLLREVGDIAIPKTIRRSQLYRNLVEATLRFLIEQVGQVKDVYPGEEKLSEDFLVRRAAGNGIELIGILTFRASPVWVLAALADASGAGRFRVREITASLKAEGLLNPGAEFDTVDEMLVGLEASTGRLAATALSAGRHTGTAVAAILLEDYRTSLKQIRETGYLRYAVDQFRPYLSAAASQFSPRRQSLTERLISRAAQRERRGSKRSRTS